MSRYLRLRRRIALSVLSTARWLLIPHVLARLALVLWRARRDLAAADVLAVYESGGFGHQIIAPDVLRRVYPGKRIVLLSGVWPGVHNWHVPLLWAEPRMHLMPFAILLRQSLILTVPFHVQVAIGATIGRWLKRRYPGKIVLGSVDEIRDALWSAARSLPGPPISALQSGDTSEYTVAYFHLMSRQPAPPVYLPASMVAPIRRALAAAVKGGETPGKLCCLYLRQRGSPSEVDSFVRTGSALSDYIPALRKLVDAGYQCLLVGDRELADDVASRFGGWLVDARTLNQDAAAVALFGATQADIFIGESGGGTFLPGVNGIPTLIVNNIPYYQTRYRATTFFKLCTDRAGTPFDLKQMFGKLSRAHEVENGIIHSNTAEQLEIAVTEFLSEHRPGEAYGIEVETILGGGANDLWYKDAQARISPAWLHMVSSAGPARQLAPDLADR